MATKIFGRGRAGRTTPGSMNKLEARYAEQLEAWRLAGDIEQWWYETFTFVLSHGGGGQKGQRYTPDFMVLRPDGMVEFHEVKGFRDQKNVNKVKVAAELYPFLFVLVRLERGEWFLKTIGARE